jgi:hypothetical protein
MGAGEKRSEGLRDCKPKTEERSFHCDPRPPKYGGRDKDARVSGQDDSPRLADAKPVRAYATAESKPKRDPSSCGTDRDTQSATATRARQNAADRERGAGLRSLRHGTQAG